MALHVDDRRPTEGRALRRLAALALVTVGLSGCAESVPPTVTVLRSARHTATDRAPEQVTLPHARPKSVASERAPVDYVFTLPARTADGLGVFVTVSSAPFAALVNGVPVFQNGDSRSAPIPYSSWRASPSFRISPLVLGVENNEMTLRMYDPPDGREILGAVLVGPPEVIERWAIREAMLNHFLPLLIGAALMGVGVISLSLWRGRRDSTLFLLLASGTLVWGAQTFLQQLPSRLLPQPHYSVLMLSLYIWFPMLLSVFFLRFAYHQSRPYEVGAAALAAVAAPLSYIGMQVGHFESVSVTLRGAALIFISIALIAVFRFALRERGAKSALLLVAGTLCVAFALRDYVVSFGVRDGRSLWLTAYSGLALVAIASWMLIDRYHRAYAAAEASNVELESRVQTANAELAHRLMQVQAAREQAEQASLAKSRFFAAASHDLRQPLHSLGLFAAALEGHVTTRDARDLVARIGDSINALEALFNELLDLSKLDAGAIAVQPRSFALQHLFDRLSLDFHGEAVARHLRMRFVPTTLVVRADPVLVERVLANLVSNALRYTRDGGVVVGARRRGAEVWLEVVDSGIGIPPEKQQQVFDEFYQIGNPGRDRRRGLGLGLAIVRRLVTLMGHRLSLDSVPGRGTRFRLALPRAAKADALVPLEQDPGIEPFVGRRVLLVEDDPDIRLATINLLEQWGMRVVACNSRREVEDVLDGGAAPDIALVDLRLDTVDDGLDVVELVRARLGAALPALLLSGDTGAAELARVRASGIPLLTKPVAPARLKSALHAYLSGDAAVAPPTVRSA